MKNDEVNKYLVPVAVVLAGLFIGGAVIWNGSHPAQPATTGSTASAWLAKVTRSISGIDEAKVAAAATANKATYDQAITADRAAAQAVGISATPSFLIGTQVVAGAYPYADFDTVIAAAIAGKTAPQAGGGKMVTVVTQSSNSVSVDGDPFIGNANAPLTIIEWTDYQCPFCGQFEKVSLPQIMQKYVDSGQVKVVFKDFPFLGPVSNLDAEYGRAVWALYPQQYFAWRTAAYEQQQPENSLTI